MPPSHRAPDRSERSRPALRPRDDATALAVASLVVLCLLWTARGEPLPALPWAAAFLFVAVWQDVRALRLPNWLTVPALAGALALGAAEGGWAGLGAALLGAGVGLAVLFGPFAMRWLGAGDVKAAMVLGALWGADGFLPALWWMLLAGGALALALLLARRGLGELVRRWLRRLALVVFTRRWTACPPEAEAAAGGLPFAVAMGLGAAGYQLWGWPWA